MEGATGGRRRCLCMERRLAAGMFGRSKSVLGLDIGSHSVKLIELTKEGEELFLTAMGRRRIDSPDLVAETVSELVSDLGVSRSKRCVTSVSGRSVIVRYVPMMRLPDEELKAAMAYEADKYIPFEVDDVVLDCQRLETDEDLGSDQMKVLLVAVKRTLVDDHVNMIESLGMQPIVVDVDVFALGNAFEQRMQRLGIDDATVRGLIDIGSSKTNINIVKGTTSYFTREIYVAGNNITEAVAKRFGEDPSDVERMKEDPGGALETMQDAIMVVLEEIGNEIRLSFDYYENQFDEEVTEVYISGGSVQFPGMDSLLSNIFNLETRLWDPSEGVDITSPKRLCQGC